LAYPRVRAPVVSVATLTRVARALVFEVSTPFVALTARTIVLARSTASRYLLRSLARSHRARSKA
jgi:hypothetical protein